MSVRRNGLTQNASKSLTNAMTHKIAIIHVIVWVRNVGEFRVEVTCIEDYPLVSFLNRCHNCDVRKDSDQSNHTIVNLFKESIDFIGHYLFFTVITRSQSLYIRK